MVDADPIRPGRNEDNEIQNKKEDFKSLASNTFMDSCNGMCKRILKDLEEYSKEELYQGYVTDKANSGRDYSAIIELGMLLNELECKHKMINTHKNKNNADNSSRGILPDPWV